MKNIACFFVNYNNSSKSIDCIKSFIDQIPHNFVVKLFIIDNDSKTSEKDLLHIYQQSNLLANISIDILFLEKNIGYFPALNFCYVQNKTLINICDFVVIGNNDLIFSKNFLKVLQCQSYSKDVFVISPNIVNCDNNHQNPQIIFKYSKLQLIYLDLYHSSYFAAWAISYFSKFIKFRGSQKSKEGYDKSQYISIGYGACYILTPEFIKNISQIPSYLFLMNEENALTDIVHKNNGRIYYDSELIVHHMEHSSINLSPKHKMFKIAQKSYSISKRHFKNKYLFDNKINH